MSDTYKLKDGFQVHKFLQLVNVSFVFSITDNSDEFLLLNLNEFGTFNKAKVDKLTEKNRVLIINNDTLEMTAYNIPEADMIPALMSM